MKILVTGAAGFIGSHLVEGLLRRGDEVLGVDSINDYYDPNLKYARLEKAGIPRGRIQYRKEVSAAERSYSFFQIPLEDKQALGEVFRRHRPEAVSNMAAQAGVRYSLINPEAYIQSNVVGFMNILELCRDYGVDNLSYASSSSVYGLNKEQPFSTDHQVDHPISLYAATKKANELMAHTYSHLYGISTTGLRFFTVYGPWGRPDMAYFLFVKAALEGRSIDLFNGGDMARDFTYVDDVIEGLLRVIDSPAQGDPHWTDSSGVNGASSAPYRIYNIGNNHPVKLMDFVEAIEKKLGVEIKKEFKPLQPGDVPSTFADVTDLIRDKGYKPATSIEEGVSRFVDWYLSFYQT